MALSCLVLEWQTGCLLFSIIEQMMVVTFLFFSGCQKTMSFFAPYLAMTGKTYGGRHTGKEVRQVEGFTALWKGIESIKVLLLLHLDSHETPSRKLRCLTVALNLLIIRSYSG